MPLRIEQAGDDDVLIAVKVVPGASRDQIAGVLGDRLKIRTSAPAEGGKANDAVRALLAGALDVKKSQVSIDRGRSSLEKVIRVGRVSVDDVRARIEP